MTEFVQPFRLASRTSRPPNFTQSRLPPRPAAKRPPKAAPKTPLPTEQPPRPPPGET